MTTRCIDCDRILKQGTICPRCRKKRDAAKAKARLGTMTSWDYQLLRVAIIRRDGRCTARLGVDALGIPGYPLAGECGLGIGAQLIVDHVVPLADGGITEPSNLRALCHAHHVRRSRWEGGDNEPAQPRRKKK